MTIPSGDPYGFARGCFWAIVLSLPVWCCLVVAVLNALWR
jgi:hypothetical protein